MPAVNSIVIKPSRANPNLSIQSKSVCHRHLRIFVIAPTLLMLAGCATLDKSECLRGDWITVGYEDGSRGFDPDQRLKRHAKACSKHEVAPDRQLYDEGYAQGLVKFCSEDSGYNYATNKSEYRGICPTELERDFLEGYTEGLRSLIYRTERSIDNYADDKDDARLDLIILSNNPDADPNAIKKAREKLDNASSQLSSARNERQQYRSRLDRWLRKLRQNN